MASRRLHRRLPKKSFVNNEELAFQYELCRKLGYPSVKEMRRQLTYMEYVRWAAYRVYRQAEWARLTDNGKKEWVDVW